ncbi:MAG: DNA mismatch repair endonuclease MutL [Chloroflexota bacterium]|nr:DNA mismatch repair endonuclease MutL [Chloroflexota bacterium]
MPIRQLPHELAGQIAAGEVVERPVSVVKELLENSIDAGATRISVEIRGGGIEKISVADDGAGIPPDEVVLAFQRHATSKLDHPGLLDAIPTLGFRGEALPSIAAVSQMTMTTRQQDTDVGYGVEMAWGKLMGEGSQGCPPGTTVQVGDLFGNLPARRNFLRSPTAEGGRIGDLVARYALAYPQIAFSLKVGDRTTLSTPGDGRQANAMVAVYGADVVTNLLEVSWEDPDSGYSVEGFTGNPSLHRANRTYMTFFVNRRWIQSRMLTFALEEAYHGLLPEKRYPLAVLNLVLPYEDVDVNSHPGKREVRFRQDGKVYSALQRGVRDALLAHSPVRSVQSPPIGRGPVGSYEAGVGGFFRSPFDGRTSQTFSTPGDWGSVPGSGQSHPEGYGPPEAALTPQQTLPVLRVVGQVRLTYIVAESPDGMYLVDQHAAHERVLFDRIVREASQRESLSQPLLAPVHVELTTGQVSTLAEQREFLSDYGFELEEFGGTAYLVRSVPAVLTTRDPGKALVDVLDMVAFEGLLKEREDVLAASLACHSAIRAGQSMTEPEMRALLEQLEVTDNPHTCPHGRPTLIHFSAYNMEREFGRR